MKKYTYKKKWELVESLEKVVVTCDCCGREIDRSPWALEVTFKGQDYFIEQEACSIECLRKLLDDKLSSNEGGEIERVEFYQEE